MAQFDFIMSEPVEDVEEGSEHEDVDGLPLGLRDSCLVTAAGDQLEEVPGSFCVDVKVGDLTQAIPVIPLVVVGGRLLVALPSPLWHRSPTQRILPAGALIKPALAMVAGVIPGDPPSQASSGVEVKVWVAYASAQLEAQVRPEEAEDVLEPAFACLPFAASLIQLADDHFSFLTAESEVPRVGRVTGCKGADRRIALGDIKQTLAALVPRCAQGAISAAWTRQWWLRLGQSQTSDRWRFAQGHGSFVKALPSELSCTGRPPKSIARFSFLDFRDHGAQPSRRFWIAGTLARRAAEADNGQGVASIQIPGSELHQPRQMDVATCSGVGLFDAGQGSGSPGSGGIDDGSRGAEFHRLRKLVDFHGELAGLLLTNSSAIISRRQLTKFNIRLCSSSSCGS